MKVVHSFGSFLVTFPSFYYLIVLIFESRVFAVLKGMCGLSWTNTFYVHLHGVSLAVFCAAEGLGGKTMNMKSFSINIK